MCVSISSIIIDLANDLDPASPDFLELGKFKSKFKSDFETKHLPKCCKVRASEGKYFSCLVKRR